MRSPAAKTAILLFVRSHRQEMQVKGSDAVFGKRASASIIRQINRRIKTVAKRSGLPAIVFTSSRQQGQTFGDRFVHAMETIFDQGFESLIAVGNDCLEVNSDTLLAVAEAVQQKKTVIGPSADGGFYLLGIHRNAFQATNFRSLPWQTSALFQSLCDKIDPTGHDFDLLDTAVDVDNLASLPQVLAAQTFADPFIKRLKALVVCLIHPSHHVPNSTTYLSLSPAALRGPPTA